MTTNPKRLLAPALTLAFLLAAGTVGAAAPGSLLATPDAPVVQADVTEAPQRLVETADDYLAALQGKVLAPLVTDYNYIRPGQLILTTFPGVGTFICTTSFLFKDNAVPKNYYIGTAGHCLLPAGEEATHGVAAPGTNYNAAGVTVQVCVANCHFGGELSGLLATMYNLGTVAYARQTRPTATALCPAGDIGNDFGLVKINPVWYTNPTDYTQTDMAVWHGPYGGTSSEGTGNLLVHHGNGIVAGTTEPSKARVAVSLNDGRVCSFQAVGLVHGGDSGSAISLAAIGAGTGANQPIGGGQALGTITHALVGAGALFDGTTIGQMITMASADAGLTLTLCDASTAIPGC